MHPQFGVEELLLWKYLEYPKIIKFLMCASNIYIICNWEID